jgi:hypothetical protein
VPRNKLSKNKINETKFDENIPLKNLKDNYAFNNYIFIKE